MATALRPTLLRPSSSRGPLILPASISRISFSSSSSALLSSSFPPLLLRSASNRRASVRRPFAAGPLSVSSSLGNLSDAELVYLSVEPEKLEEKIPTGAGVYGVYDGNGELQFIGITRNIAASIMVHRRKVPDLCRSVKVGLIDEPAPDRATLTNAWKSWMQEYIESSGRVPPGNESGNSTWVPRPQQKPDLRLTPGPHVQLTVPLEELIDRLVKENKVVAFIKGSRSAPQCGFSQRVIGILNSHGVDYESLDVLDEEFNNGLRETLKRYSNWPTFPQIFVNGELLGGCDILTAMEEKGELAAAFQK